MSLQKSASGTSYLFVGRSSEKKRKYFRVSIQHSESLRKEKHSVFLMSSLQSALFMGFQSKLIVAGLPGDVETFDNHLYEHFDGFLV